MPRRPARKLSPTAKHCDAFSRDDAVNPLTGKGIGPSSPIRAELARACGRAAASKPAQSPQRTHHPRPPQPTATTVPAAPLKEAKTKQPPPQAKKQQQQAHAGKKPAAAAAAAAAPESAARAADSLVDYMLRHRALTTLTPGVLTVAVYAHFFPVAYHDAKGELAGLDVDIMKAYAAECGLTIKWVERDAFDGIWDAPSAGTADVSIGGIANAIGRGDARTEWSIAYFYVHRSVLYRKADPVGPFPASVHGVLLGTAGSTGWTDMHARTEGMDPKLRAYMHAGTTDPADLAALLSGQAQGLMRGDFVARAILAKHPHELGMREWNIVPTLVPSDGEVFAYPCAQGSGVAVSLSAFLTQHIMDGALERWAKANGLGSSISPTLTSDGSSDGRPAEPSTPQQLHALGAAAREWAEGRDVPDGARAYLPTIVAAYGSNEEIAEDDGTLIPGTEEQADFWSRLKLQARNPAVVDVGMACVATRNILDSVAHAMYDSRGVAVAGDWSDEANAARARAKAAAVTAPLNRVGVATATDAQESALRPHGYDGFSVAQTVREGDTLTLLLLPASMNAAWAAAWADHFARRAPLQPGDFGAWMATRVEFEVARLLEFVGGLSKAQTSALHVVLWGTA